jgi:hypothetical protein
MEATEELQRSVVRGQGFTTAADEEMAIMHLRVFAQRHPEVAFWVRHNRARRGELRPNNLVPNIALSLLHGAPFQLFDAVPLDGRPLAIIALSYS